MPVIAGTTKESVINKAREVLREKEIPYTIKRTKTWFWVSSPKPGAAQTALREAGLEMNPIITMHSIWCTKCGAIRTFKKRADDWICQKCGARLLMFKNPKKVKAMVHPEALESLARYKDDLKAGHTSAAEYWRGQAGAYFTANPLNTYAVFADWGGRKGTLIGFVKANNITQAGKVATGEFGKLRNRIIRLEKKGINPLTKQEKREITNLANTQFAISRKYSDDPVRSSFWYGRSVGMGKIAKMYNPKVKKWDPISEAIEEEEEEDNMIGAEINPLSQFCCSVCETCAPKRLLPHSKFPERMRWLRHHYMRKHPGLWPWRGNPLSRELEYELEQFIRKPKLPKIEERIRLAKKFLRERGEPTDMPRVLIATKSLEDLYKSEHKNPLTAIGSAAITGVGLGIGFKSVDWMVKKIKKNPQVLQTVKDRIEMLYHTQIGSFLLYKDSISDAILYRKAGKVPKTGTLRSLSLPELKIALEYANKLWKRNPRKASEHKRIYKIEHHLQLTKANIEKLRSLTDREFAEYQNTPGDRQEILDRIIERKRR